MSIKKFLTCNSATYTMKNLTQYLHFSEISSEKTSKLTAGDTFKDSINFVGHPVTLLRLEGYAVFTIIFLRHKKI